SNGSIFGFGPNAVWPRWLVATASSRWPGTRSDGSLGWPNHSLWCSSGLRVKTMCGIAGILTDRDDLEIRSVLTRMQGALQHRGPDDEGIEEISLPGGYQLGLAHTRLAILDLSSGGHQPMSDPASGSWIVYNGEVYNHERIRRRLTDCVFRSTS